MFKNQKKWVKGNTVEEINSHLKKLLDSENYKIDFEKCINNKKIEDHVLDDRIKGVKKFLDKKNTDKLDAQPILSVNKKNFKNTRDFKNKVSKIAKILKELRDLTDG